MLKGQCQEIFCFRFFYESPSPKPLKIPLGFKCFQNSQRYFQVNVYHQYLWHRCERYWWQIMGTLSDYLRLKVKLKEKIYLNVNSTSQRTEVSKQNRTFLIQDFFLLPPVSMTCVSSAPWAANISGNFQKIEKALMGYSEAWGKLIKENNLKRKSRGTVPILYNLQNI